MSVRSRRGFRVVACRCRRRFDRDRRRRRVIAHGRRRGRRRSSDRNDDDRHHDREQTACSNHETDDEPERARSFLLLKLRLNRIRGHRAGRRRSVRSRRGTKLRSGSSVLRRRRRSSILRGRTILRRRLRRARSKRWRRRRGRESGERLTARQTIREPLRATLIHAALTVRTNAGALSHVRPRQILHEIAYARRSG